ncbi:hypothetical protein [Pedosphaera parvula]|uniref:Uncharacterized protein n=1 Tax=Pedosphaera parvula (strain Ellin514) TaxID=320771 RepID=B9XKE1_PEDPL|nr:hypothetical protein [Pedosphaera parvula]EEF59611.1 hypothetical protein Cflav_PD2600 [Pedosphaera parvula Ellin514]
MKTPREVLFEKHQGIESKLDAVRAEALAEVCDGKSKCAAHPDALMQKPQTLSWFGEFLQSLRPHFVGLTGVWLIILGVHFATRDSSPMLAEAPAPSPEVIATLKEQKQLFTQLIGSPESPQPVDPALLERRPRSEVKQYIRIV